VLKALTTLFVGKLSCSYSVKLSANQTPSRTF
jgi:hypothetical protein